MENWTTLRDQFGLKDYSFGRRVTKKITDYNEFTTVTLPALEKALGGINEGDKKGKEKIENNIKTVKEAIEDLNAALCGDMRRTKSNLGNEGKLKANLKKPAPKTGASGAASTSQNAPASTSQQSTAIDNKGPEKPKPTTNSVNNDKPAKPPSSPPPPSSPSSAKPNSQPASSTKKKKKHVGLIIFSCLVTALTGFLVGRATSNPNE